MTRQEIQRRFPNASESMIRQNLMEDVMRPGDAPRPPMTEMLVKVEQRKSTDSHSFTVDGDPVGKPRMTNGDRWMKRPCVQRYWEWKAKAKAACGKVDLSGALKLTVNAYFEMPKSWSKKRKIALRGRPHTSPPDLDNIVKAVCDSILDQDSGVSEIHTRKHWSFEEGLVYVRFEKMNHFS